MVENTRRKVCKWTLSYDFVFVCVCVCVCVCVSDLPCLGYVKSKLYWFDEDFEMWLKALQHDSKFSSDSDFFPLRLVLKAKNEAHV